MPPLPAELVLLPPLAIAAGLDLYLTLLVLGVAPGTAWWSQPLPGALGDVGAPAALAAAGILYLLELAAERFPHVALVWSVAHTVVRPLSAALLALLLFEGQPPPVMAGGIVLSGTLAWIAHAARSGGAVLRWIDPGPTPRPLLVSLLEDTLVLGLLAMMLDEPTRALAATLLLLAFAGYRAPSDVRAHLFAIRLAAAPLFPFGEHRWKAAEELPRWVRRAMAGDRTAPPGSLRGSDAAGLGLPGGPRFAAGWVVLRGESAVFVSGRRDVPGLVPLGAQAPARTVAGPFFTRVELRDGHKGHACLVFPRSGPAPEALRAEFGGPVRGVAGARMAGVEKNL
jgi:hypothetical protein